MEEKNKTYNYKEAGKKNRDKGLDTERRTRKDLIEDGWIVSKWRNNVKDNELVVARNWFIKGRGMMLGAGFPDFIAYKKIKGSKYYEVIGVEVKADGYLTSEEKEKCKWLLKNKIFSKILIAKREKDGHRISIEYKEFKFDKLKEKEAEIKIRDQKRKEIREEKESIIKLKQIENDPKNWVEIDGGKNIRHKTLFIVRSNPKYNEVKN